MNRLLALIILLLGFPVHSHEPLYSFKTLKITVAPSFKPIETYEIQINDLELPIRYFVVKYTYPNTKELEQYKYSKQEFTEISQKEAENLFNNTKSFLKEINLADDAHGEDGERWKFETSVYQDISISIWSPTKTRGYGKLLSLKDKLQSFITASTSQTSHSNP